MDQNRVTYFGETDARNKRVKFGIKAKDRTKHVYVIGKTGMGKSTLLENMAVQDIQSGEGMCFIDPHGKTADLLLEYVPKERVNDVIYIAPFDVEHPISFNVLESVDVDKKHLVVSGLMSTFKKIWVDAWSARMEYILTNTLLALLDYPGSTLLGVNRMLSDKEYRKEVVSKIIDPSVKSFWTKEFASYTERMAAEAVPAIQNKIGQFTANPLIRNMIGQPQSSFDFRKAMDQRKIIIINLSKGRIGDENMKLLGGMLVTKIYLSAMSRADLNDHAMQVMPNFYLYVDEFQNFANATFADILSEARKYKLNLTIAHQYIEQMDEEVRAAVFGNVGTMIVFRVGATDAEALEKEFMPAFTMEDLVNLGFAQIYLKLMIDGLTSSPFSATTLAPIIHPEIAYVQEIIAASRKQFAGERALVEKAIVEFHETVKKAPALPISPSLAISPAKTAPSAVPTPIQPAEKPKPDPVIKPTFSRPVETEKALPLSHMMPRPKPKAPIVEVSKKDLLAAISEAMKKPVELPPKPVEKPKEKIVEKLVEKKPEKIPEKKEAKATEPKPVSLNALKPNNPKDDPKAQTEENMKHLRSALASALKAGKLKEFELDPSIAPKTEALEEVEADIPPVEPKKDMEKPPKEVPEAVLKNVLKVD